MILHRWMMTPVCLVAMTGTWGRAHDQPPRKTDVTIRGDAFLINGRPTYEGRTWRGRKVEGLLLNSRMVQGIFDDLNPDTRKLWDYPGGPWDPERNTREFLAAMPEWRRQGLIGFTINLQGGSPRRVTARTSRG